MGTELVLKGTTGEGGNGHRDQSTWKGAVELFDRWLSLCDEFEGHRNGWKMTPIAMVKMKSTSRWKCRHFDKDKLIIVIRAAGNDSVWEYAVRPPAGITTMLAGTIATMWNGWSGHRKPEAYMANRSHEEQHEHIAQEATPSPPPSPPAEPVATSASLLEMLRAVQTRVEEAERIERQIQNLKTDLDELLAEAEELMREAAGVEKLIAEKTKILQSPEFTQALAAVQAFSGLVKGKL